MKKSTKMRFGTSSAFVFNVIFIELDGPFGHSSPLARAIQDHSQRLSTAIE